MLIFQKIEVKIGLNEKGNSPRLAILLRPNYRKQQTNNIMSSKQNTSSAAAGSSGKVRKDHFAANSDPALGISLCIPRVFNNIGWRRIKQIFIDLRWGFVERVDVIPMGSYKRAFVHFAPGRWNEGDRDAAAALNALRAGDEVKIVYDEPWYWKIGISRAEKPEEAPKPKPRPTVQISAVSTPEQKVSAKSPPTVRKPARKLKVDTSVAREEGEIAE